MFDLAGNVVDPFATRGPKALVLLFVRGDCPISNRYAPEIQRICRKFEGRSVRFWLVYPNPEATAETIRRHLGEYAFGCDALRDPAHVLVRKTGVRFTPEAAVYDARQQRVYRGRIDDRYTDFGKSRPEPTRRDLEDAIQAVIDGRPVKEARTSAVGCIIADLEP